MSAVTGEGLEELGERITAEFERTLRPVALLVPYSEGGTLSDLHDIAGDLSRTDTEDGVLVTAKLPLRDRRPLRPLRGQRRRVRLSGLTSRTRPRPRSSGPGGSSSTTLTSGVWQSTSTSWAIRSPGSPAYGSAPRLTSTTLTSPR